MISLSLRKAAAAAATAVARDKRHSCNPIDHSPIVRIIFTIEGGGRRRGYQTSELLASAFEMELRQRQKGATEGSRRSSREETSKETPIARLGLFTVAVAAAACSSGSGNKGID